MFDRFNLPSDPLKWRHPVTLTSLQKTVLRYLIECSTQEEAARMCCISKRKFEDILFELRAMNGCETNIQLVVKINADFRKDNLAA